MDDNSDQKHGLDHTFRFNVTNTFLKRLIEWSRCSNDSHMKNKLKEISINFEAATYKKSTSKDEYLAMINNKLNQMLSKKFGGDVATSATENHQRQVVHSNQSVLKNQNVTSSLQQNQNWVQSTQTRNQMIQRQVGNYNQSVQQNLNVSSSLQHHQNSLPSTQPMNQMIQRQVVHSNQPVHQKLNAGSSVEQNHKFLPSTPHSMHPPRVPMPVPVPVPTTTWSTMQPRNAATMQPTSLNQLHHIRPMNEPVRPTDRMLNTGSYQQSSQLRTHLQDTIEHKSHLPNTLLYPQTSAVPRTQVACTTALSESSFLDAGTVSAPDRKLLMTQYYHTRTTYLPDLIKVQKRVEEALAKAQDVLDCEKAERLRGICRINEESIMFLQSPESDLNRLPTEHLRRRLDKVSEVTNSLKKMLTRNQAAKQVVVSNGLQNTPLSVQHSTIVTNPVNSSSSTMELEMFPFRSQSKTPVYSSPDPTLRRDVQTNNLNMKRNSEAMQQQQQQQQQPTDKDQPVNKQQVKKLRKLPKEKDFMDSMFISSPKITSRNASSRPPRGGPTPTKQSVLTSSTPMSQLKPSTVAVDIASIPVTPATADLASTPLTPCTAMPQLKSSTVAVDLASIPVTPSSIPNDDIRKQPAEFVSPNEEVGAVKDEDETTKVQEKSGDLGTSTSSLPIDESNPLPDSAITPFQRLLRLMHTVSDETLKSSVNDMYSAIQDMDELPEFDGYVENKPSRRLRYINAFPRESFPF
ncbi:uncharacterized protein [Spinacia oleracea]|uniref:Uncharacterized protein isoform X2 n=1 Tax=Spinacia oleracea TaxID=3562 RepID=A0ABM3R4S4_SPIOL|nr:uncharacterized protein LOC130465776 isoform X2 [Spinacia oleracea]